MPDPGSRPERGLALARRIQQEAEILAGDVILMTDGAGLTPRAFAEAEAIARHPQEADNIRAFRASWPEMIPHCYEDSAALFRKLAASEHDVTLLTNFASDTFSVCRARYPFLEEGRGITVSGEIGMVKPDRDIFEHHTEVFGLTPEATLFIDDKAVNIEGAKAIGWHGIQFKNAAQLEQDLARYGITV